MSGSDLGSDDDAVHINAIGLDFSPPPTIFLPAPSPRFPAFAWLNTSPAQTCRTFVSPSPSPVVEDDHTSRRGVKTSTPSVFTTTVDDISDPDTTSPTQKAIAHDIPEDEEDNDVFYDCEDATSTAHSNVSPRNTVKPTTDDMTALMQRFSRTDKHRASSRHEQARPPPDPVEDIDNHALQDFKDGYEDAHQKSFEDK
ncbi:hypothetical protein EDB89DRAFT_2084200 [Lactarius sanguifluus]|nr:hypothetical protein EDB89DRAFT_2084200 [Lactarius sanguifluus]